MKIMTKSIPVYPEHDYLKKFENPLLRRQILKHLAPHHKGIEGLDELLKAIDATYQIAERDRALINHSLIAVSEELTNRNTVLLKEKEEQKILIKKLEEAHNQLLQSEKMASIGQLAAGVAHEINNPIGYVSSNITTLRNYIDDLFALITSYIALEEEFPIAIANHFQNLREQIDVEYLKQDIQAIFTESSEGITKVKKIVQDLKDFSRVDSIENWTPSDIHQGIDSALNIAANEIKYSAQVTKEYGDIDYVECILSQLNQVFLNLIINATHAFEKNKAGTIHIKTGQIDQTVFIEISDNGCGIPAENLTKIFDPFFTTKPVGVGTGLGLSISYGIINKHGGNITVTSKPQQGTCFRIELPVHHENIEQK
jgi:two-component system, NtrC family, sensor kinase